MSGVITDNVGRASGLIKAAGGGTNTPAFFAISTSSEDGTDVSDNTATKKTFSTEIFDSDGTYDNSTNFRFTPGVAGKYLILAKIRISNNINGDTPYMNLYKNGSATDGTASPYTTEFRDGDSANAQFDTYTLNIIVDADDDDYYEIFFKKNDGGNSGGAQDGYFGAFRILL